MMWKEEEEEEEGCREEKIKVKKDGVFSSQGYMLEFRTPTLTGTGKEANEQTRPYSKA